MLEARGIRLRSVRDSDLPQLIEWRNDTTQLYLWSTYRHIGTEAETTEEIASDLRYNRHITMIIERVRDGVLLGSIFSYDVQFVDGHCFVTTFIDSRYQRRGYGAIAHGLFLDYLFTYFAFSKVYSDAYGYNAHSQQTMQNAGYKVEGRFPNHRYYNGAYHEMIRFAFYRSQHGELQELMKRMSTRKAEGDDPSGRRQRR